MAIDGMRMRKVLAAMLVAVLAGGCSTAVADVPTASPSDPATASPAVALVSASASVAPTATLAPSPTASPTPTTAPTTAPPATATARPTFTPPPISGDIPVAALDADGLTAQLVAVEKAIRDPAVSGSELEWMAHLEQLVVSTLADHPDWQPGALAALPERERAAVAGTLAASDQLHTMHGTVARSLPNWSILAPKQIDVLLGFYREAEAAYGVPWYYLAAIHLVESRMGRIHGLSTAGAQGPMQFIPSTWEAYGTGDINDDHDAILGAANYLRASGAPGNMDKAIYAYNHSWGYVGAIKAYAAVMAADPDAYRGYWGWQVYYTTQDGTFLLQAGWTKS